jgi:hypothetical protein
MQSRSRTVLAWSLWLATFGCCAAGPVIILALTRPLTLGVLAEGAAFALAFALGFATIGLVITLRLPANPIGWLYAAAGLAWAWNIPFGPWMDRLIRDLAALRVDEGDISASAVGDIGREQIAGPADAGRPASQPAPGLVAPWSPTRAWPARTPRTTSLASAWP